jgi:GNAT superfamily N-acetyltransferase
VRFPGDVNLTWLNSEDLQRRDVAGAVAVLEAHRQVDCPFDLGPTTSSLTADLRHGWDGDPPLAAVYRDPDDRVTAFVQVHLPQWDNKHLAFVDVAVDPGARRHGLGRRLFEAGMERARSESRTVVLTGCYEDSPGVEFAKAIGLDRASREVKRRQDLRTLDRARLDKEYAVAQERAVAYDLLRLAGPVPDELIADVATMSAAINDAPTDDLDIEDEVFSPERIRAFETGQDVHDRRTYRLVARERNTGEMAGHTMVAVEGERPWHGWQYDTSVLRAHRGHRLGLVLKIAMLYWLAEEEPQLLTIDTWNAKSNKHMVEVNEVLGYDILTSGSTWQKHL